MIENSCSTSRDVSAAVGSSMTTMAASNDTALAISTSCRCATLRSADGSTRVHRQTELLEQLRGSRVHRSPIDHTGPAAAERLLAQEQVLGDREPGDHVDFLVDHADAGVLHGPGTSRLHGAAAEQQAARIGPMDAGQDFHEGGFAGSVLTHQRMHFARPQIEINTLQGLHARESLADPLHPQELLAAHAWFSGSRRIHVARALRDRVLRYRLALDLSPSEMKDRTVRVSENRGHVV